MWKVILTLVFVQFILYISAEDESERPRLFGVPTRRTVVDNSDPNHLRVTVENGRRRIPIDRLEPDKATSIFASMEKNPLTRTTLDTTIAYTKAPVNLDDILRKKRSPIVEDFIPSVQHLQTNQEKSIPKKADKIPLVSEYSEDPFETIEPQVLKDSTPKSNAENKPTTPKVPNVAVIDSDAQFEAGKRKVVRHLVANDLNTTLSKLRIRRTIIDSEIEKATVPTPTASLPNPRTTLKTPVGRLTKSPNTSNFVALDNQNSREVVEREEIQVVPRLIRKLTTATTTTEAPTTKTTSTLPPKILQIKPLNVIDIDTADIVRPTVVKASKTAAAPRQSFLPSGHTEPIGPVGPPIVWSEFIIPSEGRRILVKSIPAAYFNNTALLSAQHSGIVQNPRTKVPVIESDAILTREKQPVSLTTPHTPSSIKVPVEPLVAPISLDARDQVKSEDLQLLRIYEREGTTRTAFVTKHTTTTTPATTTIPATTTTPAATTTSTTTAAAVPQIVLSSIPRIVKPTRTHEAAMKAAAKESHFPVEIPMAKSDIPDPRQFAKNQPKMITINSNGASAEFRAHDIVIGDEPRSKPLSVKFAEKFVHG